MKILIIGKPKSGKTTLVKSLVNEFKGLSFAGFFTEEVLENKGRIGFDLVSIREGKRIVFARKRLKTKHFVGSYGVDVDSFEKFLRSLDLKGADFVIVDEVGKMECLSSFFREWLFWVYEKFENLIVTAPEKGTDFIEEFKKKPEFVTIYLTQQNRPTIKQRILDLIASER
ncbi:MAG: hypothetical protein N2440_01035 [Actinobacteria bacterium]|nr:hypothetical protein [Actinomycetota bacterium]